LKNGIFRLQVKVFSASALAERKYAQPSQFLKNFLKKKASISATRASGLEGGGPRRLAVSVSPKIH
jgi:hypothetical protein